jgi:hypothetical protein
MVRFNYDEERDLNTKDTKEKSKPLNTKDTKEPDGKNEEKYFQPKDLNTKVTKDHEERTKRSTYTATPAEKHCRAGGHDGHDGKEKRLIIDSLFEIRSDYLIIIQARLLGCA